MSTHPASEKGSDYYNDLFAKQQYYNDHYSNIHYYVQWVQVEMILRPFRNRPILEIGCGTGQFAQMLHDLGYTRYSGFDFSDVAIDLARKRVPLNFAVGDALDPTLYSGEYDAVVCLEVLEHLEKDHQVLENIKPGTFMVISVPNFDDRSHVRWFRSPYQIRKRFYRHMRIDHIRFVNNIYIVSGERSDFKPNLLQRIFKTRTEEGLGRIFERLRYRLVHLFKIKHQK